MELIEMKYMFTLVVLVVTFLSGNYVLPRMIKYFETAALVDKPNWRSSHKIPTPSSGGLSFVFTLLVMIPFLHESTQLAATVFSALILAALGFADDRLTLQPKLKFLVQFMVASIIYYSSLRFNFLNGVFGFYEISSGMGYTLTVIFIVAIINAYNLIDGVDGLAGGLAGISSFVFGILFLINNDYVFCLLAFSLTGSLLAFLRHNFNPAKIFMGDTGSLVIGLLMAVFFIRMFNYNNGTHATVSLAALLFPVIDMARLIIVRIMNKRSPFEADNNHYHHLLIKSGDSHKQVAISGYIILSVQFVLAIAIGTYFEITMSFILLISISMLMYVFISLKYYHLSRKKSKDLMERINASKNANILIAQFNEK